MRYRHGCNGILIESYTHPTRGFHFEWPWVTLRNIQWDEGPIGAPRRKTMLSYLVTNRPRHVTFALDLCSCHYALTKCRWLTPSLPTWTVSPYIGCWSLHPLSPFIIITQPKSWYSFYRPTESRRQQLFVSFYMFENISRRRWHLGVGPGQVFPLWGYLKGLKIPNFDREYLENGKLWCYISNGA